MLLVGSAATLARADEPAQPAETPPPVTPPPPAQQPPPENAAEVDVNAGTEVPMRWYGWQVLLCDAGAGLQIGLGAALDVVPLEVTGGSTYGICPIVVHLAHGQVGGAATSGGARILFPLVGATLGYAIGLTLPDQDTANPTGKGALIGALTGVGLAIVGDVVWLSREVVPLWERARLPGGMTPLFGANGVGVAGRF